MRVKTWKTIQKSNLQKYVAAVNRAETVLAAVTAIDSAENNINE